MRKGIEPEETFRVAPALNLGLPGTVFALVFLRRPSAVKNGSRNLSLPVECFLKVLRTPRYTGQSLIGETMDAIECIKSRTSIRKFKSDPVPRKLLVEIIEAACQSPSYRNCQPWEVAVVSGRKKQALSDLLIDLAEKGVTPKPDIPAPAAWPKIIEERMEDHFHKRARNLGIDLSDPNFMKHSLIENFRFYGAAHAMFLFQDSSLSSWQILDMGIFAQSLMLAAHAMGLGTVPQAYVTNYAAEVKTFLNIPESKRLVLGLSLGYPDPDAPAGRTQGDRMDVGSVVRWIE